MNTTMEFPDTPEQFLDMFSFTDTEEYYTNGQRCITLHRVGQMLEHYFPERTCFNASTRKDERQFTCSACWLPVFISLVDGTKVFPNYCPHCGAKVVD